MTSLAGQPLHKGCGACTGLAHCAINYEYHYGQLTMRRVHVVHVVLVILGPHSQALPLHVLLSVTNILFTGIHFILAYAILCVYCMHIYQLQKKVLEYNV